MTAWRFPCRHLLLLLVVALASLFAYDLHLHGSFPKSRIGRMLKEVGFLAVCEQAWGKITVYSGKAYGWLQQTVPVYCAAACAALGPYVEMFWQKFFQLCSCVWDNTQWMRDWFNANVPPLLLWMNDNLPKYGQTAAKYFTEGLILAQKYFVWLWGHVSAGILATGSWLQSNVFTGQMSPENIQRLLGDAVEVLQKYTLAACHWFSQQLSGIVTAVP